MPENKEDDVVDYYQWSSSELTLRDSSSKTKSDEKASASDEFTRRAQKESASPESVQRRQT